VHEFWLDDINIRPCQGCFRCAEESSCIVDDDMQRIYPEIVAADLVVFATPIYWWHMNAQMKLCVDRMTALLAGGGTLPALAGKHVVLVVTYRFENCARATKDMFKDFEDWIDVKLDVIESAMKNTQAGGKALRCDRRWAKGVNEAEACEITSSGSTSSQLDKQG